MITQPAQENTRIALEIGADTVFVEEFEEPNFLSYLDDTAASIRRVIADDLYIVQAEATMPEQGLFYCNQYLTVDDWVEDHEQFCADLEAFRKLAAKMRDIADGQRHNVCEYWRQYQVLLRKK